MKQSQYPKIKFIGGVCSLVAAGMLIGSGIEGEMMNLFLGLISLALGISLFYGLSKK